MREYILYASVKHYASANVAEMIEKIQMSGGVLGTVDDDSGKWSEAEKIFSPEIIGENPSATIIVMCSTNFKKIVEFIRSRNWQNKIMFYPWLRFAYFKHNEPFEGVAPYHKQWCESNRAELEELYNVKKDNYTKRCLDEILRQRSMPQLEFIELDKMIDFEHIHLYFYDREIAPKGDITFVDGGAFDGDSTELVYREYGDNLKRVYAFEPDESSVSLMKERLHKLGIENLVQIYQYGLWNKDAEMNFLICDDPQQDRVAESGNKKVKVCTLDSIITKVDGDLCVKYDLEGAEIQALDGAKETIKKYHPYLAICIYHNWNDILEIPRKIKAIREDYDFYLRCGVHMECYAVPRK